MLEIIGSVIGIFMVGFVLLFGLCAIYISSDKNWEEDK
jgi:hypothetical protein